MNNKRKQYSWTAAALAVLLLAGCGPVNGKPAAGQAISKQETEAAVLAESTVPEESTAADTETVGVFEEPYVFTDCLGNTVTLEHRPQTVAGLMGSYAEIWLLAGGELAGVTEDADSERGLKLSEDVVQLGSVKEPNLEKLLAMEPDLVLLSSDTEGHLKLAGTLEAAGIPAAYFHADTFDEYLSMLKICTDITGRFDLYEKNGTSVRERVDAAIASAQGKDAPRVLYLRAFSSGVKAKGEDSLLGAMLKDLGAVNIADEEGSSLLDDLQLESVLDADPDFILVTTMGEDTQKALDMMKTMFEDNPAWNTLTAVKEGRYQVLPKELFHYKPNVRWGESYEMLADILYGEEDNTESQ